MRVAFLLFSIPGLALATAALAQTTTAPESKAAESKVVESKVERVIVTAPKWLGDRPQLVIHNFVRSYAMATTSTIGEIARWKFGICTRTYGLSKPEYNKFVTDRVEEIAVETGVTIKSAPCRPNVELVFTDKPQDFLDRVRKDGVRLLGPRPSQSDAVAQMRHPIQAWYATGSRDLDGSLLLDDEDDADAGFNGNSGAGLSVFARVPTRSVEGFRWRTGLNAELVHIYVIADTSQTQRYELGAVADYIAMLSLSQTQSFDACKPMPSITNLISSACDPDLKPKAITDTDLAFLRGVYTMDPGANIEQQQNHIAGAIAASLGVP
jgi:hypothetical protein